MTTKNILYCDNPLEVPGGGQVSLLQLLCHLDRSRFTPQVLLPSKSVFSEWLSEKAIPVAYVDGRGYKEVVEEIKPDLIHCNAATNRFAFRCAMAARQLKVPFLWHVRVTEPSFLRDRLMAALSTRIIAISDAVASKFKFCSQKVTKVYNGVNLDQFKSAEITWDNIENFNSKPNPGIPVIGMFARFDDWKGHGLLLKAIALLRDEGVDAQCLFVGTGENDQINKLNLLAEELNLKDSVFFAGFREDIPRLMNLCSVIVNPSTDPEPFGRVVIEAMACGVPVVATALGGPVEIIEQNKSGILVEAKEEALAQGLKGILTDQGFRESLSRAGLERVQSLFSIQAHTHMVEQIYEEMMKK